MKIRDVLMQYLRDTYKAFLRLRLRNRNFSLIASNCNGMFMLKDLKLRYQSPFVNLWLHPKDFIKFLNNMDYYLNQKLKFIHKDNIMYPVGKLADIEIYFQHYKSEEEAFNKWNIRIKRINKNNLFILMTDRDGCTKEDLINFERIPFKNKIVFTHIKYTDLKSTIYIPGFEKENCVGMCFEYASKYSVRRRYDCFDYVSWFNEK